MIENRTMVFALMDTLMPRPESGESGVRANAINLLKHFRANEDEVYVAAPPPSELPELIRIFLKYAVSIGYVTGILTVPPGENGGKSYQAIAQARGYGATQHASRNMIVIGGDIGDRPNDLDRVVTLIQPKGHLYDARILKFVIETLYQKGKGDFQRGFEVLTNQVRKLMPAGSVVWYSPSPGRKPFTLSPGIATASYDGKDVTSLLVEISAPSWRRPLDPLG